MKRLALFLASVLLLAGCTKPDPDPIVGMWKIAACTETFPNGETFNFTIGSSPVSSWLFKEDGTGQINGYKFMQWRREDKTFLYITDLSVGVTLKYEILNLADQLLKVYWWDSREDVEWVLTFMPWDVPR
jgi:hypothetical protein